MFIFFCLETKENEPKEKFKAVRKKLKNDCERLKSANSHFCPFPLLFCLFPCFFSLSLPLCFDLLRHTDFLTPSTAIFLHAFYSRPTATQVIWLQHFVFAWIYLVLFVSRVFDTLLLWVCYYPTLRKPVFLCGVIYISPLRGSMCRVSPTRFFCGRMFFGGWNWGGFAFYVGIVKPHT